MLVECRVRRQPAPRSVTFLMYRYGQLRLCIALFNGASFAWKNSGFQMNNRKYEQELTRSNPICETIKHQFYISFSLRSKCIG